MKRFPELARRGVALALAASMSLSVFMPGALAADLTTAEEHDHDHDHVHLAAENSVDALGNEDLSDEIYNVPGDTAFTAAGAAADTLGGDDEEEIDLDDLTEEQLAEQAAVDASGHEEHTPDTDAEPVYEQPATCAERGYAIYPCSFTLEQEDGTVAHCYHQVVVWLPLADHAWGEWQEPDDADSQKYRVCTVCNAVEYEDGTVVTPGGIPITDPDQPEWLPGDGSEIATCSLLDDLKDAAFKAAEELIRKEEQNVINKDHPHTHVKGKLVATVEATCIKEGYKEYQCNKKFQHKITVTVDNPLPFGQKQYTYSKKITLTCKEKTKEPIKALGHSSPDKNDPANWKVTKKPTCKEDGERVMLCTVCGQEIAETKEKIPMLGGDHNWVKDAEKSIKPTCTTDGTDYFTCSKCNATKSETVPATGHHTGGEDDAHRWTKDDGSDVGWGKVNQPYPCKPGTKTRECDICHETETVTVPATEEHKYDEFVSTTQPYPCKPGKETWKCTVCSATTTIDAKVAEHVLGEYEDDPVLGCAPTEQHTESRYCTVCGAKTNTRPNGKTQQPHRFTHYVLATKSDGELYAEAQCDNVLYDRDGNVVKRCEVTDHAVITGEALKDLNKLAGDMLAKPISTFAAEAAAKSVMPVIENTLKKTQEAVKNASSREEAINALDELYTAAVEELSDKALNVEFKYDLGNSALSKSLAWLLKMDTKGTLNVPITITKSMAENMLRPLKKAMDSVKEMLNNSFLSEDAIKDMVGKLVDTVRADSSMKKIEDSIADLAYPEVHVAVVKYVNEKFGTKIPNPEQDKATTDANQKTVIGSLILQLAQTAVDNDSYWQPFLDAIFDDLIDMLIEQLKKNPEYSKYLNNALGDELLEELRPKLREELVNDTTFVNNIRDVASDAIKNAAIRVNAGWSDDQILAQLREDLLKVQGPVEQEMLDLSATIGDLVESSLAEKINKFLPFGDLTSWIGKWVGAFAKDKAVSEVVGETGKVRQTIEMYIKYITCGEHRHVTENIAATCTEPAYTIDSCSKCGWRFSKEKTGEPLGHTPVTVKGYEATETADGLTDGIQCARCGAWLEPQEVIPAQEPQYEKYLVKSAITADTVKAAGYKNQKKLDEAIDAALTKAGYQTANSERFLAQVQTSIGILSNDRYPEDGVTGMVKLPAGAAGKNCTFYAVQVLTADTHGYSAGDVVITPLTVTSEGISFKLPVQSVVAIAWKVNE